MHHDMIRPADSSCDVTDVWREVMDRENDLNQIVTAYFDHAVIAGGSSNPDDDFDCIAPILDRFEVQDEDGTITAYSRVRLIEMFGLREICRVEALHADSLNP